MVLSGYAEVAEIGWSNTMKTLPDRLEDYSLTNR